MRREYREHFPRHWLQRKPLVSDPGMHHGTCVTQVPWCMSGSLTRGGRENVPFIPGACATRNIRYLVRSPCNYTGNGAKMNASQHILNSLFSGDLTWCNFKSAISELRVRRSQFYGLRSWALVRLFSDECRVTHLVISWSCQFSWWLGAVRQQAIT